MGLQIMADEMQEQTLFNTALLFENTAILRRSILNYVRDNSIKIGLEIHCQLTHLTK